MSTSLHDALLFPSNIIGDFRYADWQGAWQRHGIPGVLWEGLAATFGTNTWPFFVPLGDRGQMEATCRSILNRKSIPNWGYGDWAGQMYFRVPKRVAGLAQTLLQKGGVQVSGRILAGERQGPEPSSAKSRVSEALKKLW